jgi:arylsulfatase A
MAMTKTNLARRTFLKAVGAATLSAALPLKAQRQKPNIVLIMADDMGYECLGSYGGTSYKTPNLDALAKGGVRFTHAYAQPLCTPTRLQLMTGQYNFRNWKAFGVMDPKEKTFGHIMQAAGYKTCIAGKWQLYSYNPPDFEPEWRGKGMRVQDAGFDEYCLWHSWHTEDKGSRYADPTFFQDGQLKTVKGKYGEDVFCDFINNFVERRRNEPFFVYYPMTLTHPPFMPTPGSPEWPAGDRLKANQKHYGDMVEYMDKVVGRVVANLDRLGLRERTLILFYSDNGTPVGVQSRMGGRIVDGGKGLTTDAGMHVPLIADWKGTTPRGRVLEDLVDSTDFLPAIVDATGAKMPKGMPVDGRSFLPQLRGKRGNPKEWIYCHYDPRPGHGKEQYTLKKFARNQRFKLYSDGRLFDISKDVLEQHPLSPGEGGEEAARARKKLQAALDSLWSA